MKLDIDVINKYEGFSTHTGIVVLDAKDGVATSKIDLKKYHRNPIGSVHGGCLFTMADYTGGVAVRSAGINCTTLSAHISYLNGAMMDSTKILFAKAEPKRVGRKIAVYDVTITDDKDKLIATVVIEYYVIPQQPDTLTFLQS